MKEIINQIISNSKFTIECFDGRLLLEGRILSPSEAQAAGLTSGLLAASMANPNEIEKMSQINDDESDDNLERLIQIAKRIRPESLEAIGEAHDKIICKVISRASSDNGSSWQKIHIVHGVDQQNADQNRLWVGMIPEEDRRRIIDQAMTGHQNAVAKIRGSL